MIIKVTRQMYMQDLIKSSFDLIVAFPHEILSRIKNEEIYEVICEDAHLYVKTLFKTNMSGTPVYFCKVLGDISNTKMANYSFLSVDRLGKPLTDLEKKYYDLFM